MTRSLPIELSLRRVGVASNVTNAFLASGIFLVLTFWLPLTLVQWHEAEFRDLSLWISMSIVAYSSVRLSLIIARDKPEWLQAGFWVFTYVFMGLALLAQIAAAQYPEPHSYADSVLSRSAGCILVGLIAYDVGRFLAGKPRAAGERSSEPLAFSVRRAVALGLLGLAFVWFAVDQFGISPFFTSRNAVDQAFQGRGPSITPEFIKGEDKAAGALFQQAAKVPVFVALYLLLLMMKKDPYKSGNIANRFALLGLMVILGLANMIVNNPIGNGRFAAGLVLIGFISLFVNIKNRNTLRLAAAAFLTVFLFAFSALDVFRLTDVRDFGRGGSVSEVLLTHLDYGTTQVAHETITYVQSHGHTYGRQLLASVGFWVPRRIWYDKPIPTGSLVNRGFIVVSSSLWNEGYIDFGLIGTFLFLAFYGWGSRRLDNAFHFASSNSFLYALMPLMVGSQFILVRGSLTPALGKFLFLLLLVRACFRRSDRRPKAGSKTRARKDKDIDFEFFRSNSEQEN